MNNYVSIVLPTYNEEKNVIPIIQEIVERNNKYNLEIIVVDDNSTDNTESLIRDISRIDPRVRLINRIDRFGLSSAIKEGCLNARGDIIAVMDSDGQHEVKSLFQAIEYILINREDLVIGSRFLDKSSVEGLSKKRKDSSSIANNIARVSLNNNYKTLTDYLSGFFLFKRYSCISIIKRIDVNGFKFLYELLALSKGRLKVCEVPLKFKPRRSGNSKLDIAVVWDFNISIIHSFLGRLIPRRAISFGIVGLTGVFVQLTALYFLLWITEFPFIKLLPFAVIVAACSNFFINNLLTFKNKRLYGLSLCIGLIKFLLVSSLPLIANVGLASSFYFFISSNTFFSQLAGIFVVFIWNYAASSKFVWNN
tara:strand:- start:1255 stop:2349 length:1095 start_codon:yes stop_codon:yes gene_type:complete